MTLINPESLGAPRGYSNGVLLEGGRLLFVAGQIGWDSDQRLVSGRFVDQFKQALSNVVTVVRAAGGAAEHIAQLRIFVTDKSEYLDNLKDVGAAYRSVMGRHYPAMALLEVKGLVEDLARVEIEAIAGLPSDSAGAA
jgi:enamine deaminase RidA (YjgF/YER057c/UK114 family)